MTPYFKAKQYFIQLASYGNETAINLLEEYEEIKEQKGSFIAALFLRNIYQDLQLRLKEVKNG